ncbi:MAG: transcriptional regulator [Williamsia sp.]|nr:transcriptional regulator [Williamsia sp.]
MKHKFISSQSGRLLGYFNNRQQTAFGYAEASQALPDSSESALRELLSDMTRRGLLMRLKEGVYHIIPYESDPGSFMPDWHLIAGQLTGDAKYYIGFYSALQIHNLITQPSLKEQIVVSKQIRPSEIKVRDISFQFIYYNTSHFFGSKKVWIDNFNKVPCSDLEKTLIDCLFRPDYAGGIVEIARAIYVSRDNIHFNRLLDYTKKFRSQAVIKRLGYLLDLLDIRTNITGDLQREKTTSYVPLDTEVSKSGRLISKWSIQQNVEPDTITSALYT